MTLVDRQTRCILGWSVVWTRTQESIQRMVDEAPKAKWYYSDGFDAYQWLWYHSGRYEVSVGKADTYSVEGDNAELRHYLARLTRQAQKFGAEILQAQEVVSLERDGQYLCVRTADGSEYGAKFVLGSSPPTLVGEPNHSIFSCLQK